MAEDDETIKRFEQGALDAGFSHAAHVRVGRAYLMRFPFPCALSRMAGGIQAMALRSGKAEAFNLTITAAFLSLIGERMIGRDAERFERFAADNPDLFDPAVLSGFYSPERLRSSQARSTFLLPDQGQQ